MCVVDSDAIQDSAADIATRVDKRHSVLGAVAGLCITWFVGTVFTGLISWLIGVIVAGPQGARVGVTISVAIVSGLCMFSEKLRIRVLFGLFIGISAAAIGVVLAHPAGVVGGVIGGLVTTYFGNGDLDSFGERNFRALRAIMGATVGAAAGAAGTFLGDSFPMGD